MSTLKFEKPTNAIFKRLGTNRNIAFCRIERNVKDLMNISAKVELSLSLLLKEIKSLDAHEKASISEQIDDLDIAVRVFGEMQSEMRTCFYPDAEDMIYWYELPTDQESMYLIIKASPLHVNEQLYEKVFKNKSAVIATSATLTISERFKYFMKRSGLEMMEGDRVKTVIYESPFNYEEQCEIW